MSCSTPRKREGWFSAVFAISWIAITMILPCVAEPGISSNFTDFQDCGPYLTGTTSTGTILHWGTVNFSLGRVTIVSNDAAATLTESTPGYFHYIRVEGLLPATRYSYSIENIPGVYSFSTYPETGQVRFIVIGDTQAAAQSAMPMTPLALVAERIASEPDISFVLHLGDFITDTESVEDWDRFFRDSAPFLKNTTLVPVAGNHEENLEQYYDLFSLPSWYEVSCGDARVLVLNSNTLTGQREWQQHVWLVNAFNLPQEGTFIAMHHPLITSDPRNYGGYLRYAPQWEPLIRAHTVPSVFAGHVHAYEHFERNGTHFMTLGTGGASFTSLSSDNPQGFRARHEQTLGYGLVTVNRTHALIDFIKVAEVQNNTLAILPPGTIGDRLVLRLEKERGGVNSLPRIPLFFGSD